MKPVTHTVFLCAVAAALALLVGGTAAMAADVSFKGKTITILAGTTAGGSTDLSARLMAPFIAKYLPGKPDIIVQNRPGAHGMMAMNFFARQVKPDGLTMIVGSSSQIDPINYRVPKAQYDPAKFEMIGGVGIGGTVTIIRNEALPRLLDKGAKPVTMGSVSGVPRSGMQMTAWGIDYLGWNVKWVSGYRGTPDLILALERGEIDMTSFANTEVRPSLLDTSKYRIIYQSGSNRATQPASLPAIAKTPMFAKAMAGKISDPLAKQAFAYWRNISSVSKWAALPPNTPKPIVAAYHAAFHKLMADPDFIARGQKISEDLSAVSPEDVTDLVQALARTSPAAVSYITEMLTKQGLKVDVVKKKKKKKKKKS